MKKSISQKIIEWVKSVNGTECRIYNKRTEVKEPLMDNCFHLTIDMDNAFKTCPYNNIILRVEKTSVNTRYWRCWRCLKNMVSGLNTSSNQGRKNNTSTLTKIMEEQLPKRSITFGFILCSFELVTKCSDLIFTRSNYSSPKKQGFYLTLKIH